MQFNRLWPALLLAAGLAACSERPAPMAPEESPSPAIDPTAATSGRVSQARLERLARRTARALRDPSFRADVRAALDRSTLPRGQGAFPAIPEGQRGAWARGASPAPTARPRPTWTPMPPVPGTLEMYFPVPAHRAAWNGDENVLVATAERDGEAPVAYDLAGRRIVLSPDTPPSTPVLAVEPAEQDFDRTTSVANATCTEETCAGGGGGYVVPPTPGLYMTRAEFVESFESWLKGDPEYEIHIMGPAAKGDNTNLVSFQCVGEHAASPYCVGHERQDLDGKPAPVLEGTDRCHEHGAQGSAVHDHGLRGRRHGVPDQDGRRPREQAVYGHSATLIGDLKSAKGLEGKLEAAPSLFKLLAAIYSFLTTADDIIGVVVSDSVTGRVHTGTNWTALNDKTGVHRLVQAGDEVTIEAPTKEGRPVRFALRLMLVILFAAVGVATRQSPRDPGRVRRRRRRGIRRRLERRPDARRAEPRYKTDTDDPTPCRSRPVPSGEAGVTFDAAYSKSGLGGYGGGSRTL